jgi:hypothetical protein
MLCSVCDFIDGSIKASFVRARWFCESAQFPDKLQRGCANLIIRRGRTEIMQGFDVSAHDRPSAIVDAGATISRCRRFWFGEEFRLRQGYGVTGSAPGFTGFIERYKHS